MNQPLVEPMRAFGTTIFAEMSALALTTASINLGQGFPDSDGPPEILDAAVEAIRSGFNQYPPGSGQPTLRHAIAGHQNRFYGVQYDADTEVLVTAGATEAIASALLALTGPGDEVVMFEPYYDSYAACVALSGAQRKVVTLRPTEAGWRYDPEQLERAFTGRTRVVLLNTPHNPTGKVFDRSELEQIAQLARRHDAVVVTDEVYEHLVFDGMHVPMSTLPGMRDRTITISSAGKTFSVTGWKIGWVCAAAPYLNAVRTVKQFLTYVNGGPFQPAVAFGLGLPDEVYAEVREGLRAQRDLLCGGLQRLGFDVITPQATYFATVRLDAGGLEFCQKLPRERRVVAIPSSVFYDSHEGDRLVRFAFCKRPDVLVEALGRLEGVGR
ncbi:MAG: pyridoxal phosphate-dependent aminotransferase [Actinobacteria bacterium]|nr:pyridoxal phosphate-dependent aminotransferase [Actinomycetota bacterium]